MFPKREFSCEAPSRDRDDARILALRAARDIDEDRTLGQRVGDALDLPTTANRALSLSGDDFAEYLLQTKGAYAYLGTANPKKPHTCISNHRGDFDIDEETLPLGAALYAAYALSVLDPQFAK